MEVIALVIVAGVVIFIISRVLGNSRGFNDPKPMSNHQIVAAIAGQAEWLEKMSNAPMESQRTSSIVELSQKRRGYISQLCAELLSLSRNSSQELYPGASDTLDMFEEAREYAKDIEGSGVSKEVSIVRAVKEKLFRENGYIYPTSWEN